MKEYLKNNWKGLIISVVIAEIVGVVSGLLSNDPASFYSSLKLPPLSPPSWVFGVVWPILYLLMGVAAYLIYDRLRENKPSSALWIYVLQLAVNFLWTIIFFRLHLLWAAAAVVILLDILVIYMIYKFYKISPLAGGLLVPYLLWILFATYLTIAIAVLN